MAVTPTQRSLARLEQHIAVTDNGCWRWVGAHDANGYGRCSIRTAGLGEQWAHRLVYRLFVGPIPDGLMLDHLCRVVDCVNPAHLEPVTRSVNALRSPIIGRTQSRKTHCVNGHERTPDNLYIAPTTGHSSCRICRAEASLRWRRR